MDIINKHNTPLVGKTVRLTNGWIYDVLDKVKMVDKLDNVKKVHYLISSHVTSEVSFVPFYEIETIL